MIINWNEEVHNIFKSTWKETHLWKHPGETDPMSTILSIIFFFSSCCEVILRQFEIKLDIACIFVVLLAKIFG